MRFFCNTLAQLGSTLVAVTLSMKRSWKNAICWQTVHSIGIVGCCSSKNTRGEDGLSDAIDDEDVEASLSDFERRGEVDDPVDDNLVEYANLLDLGEEIRAFVAEFVGAVIEIEGERVGEGGVVRPDDRSLVNI